MTRGILYAGLPLALLLTTGASAQTVSTDRPLQLAQNPPQITVYRTTVREQLAPESRNAARARAKQSARKQGRTIVRTTTTERIVEPAPVPTFVTADPLDLTPSQRTAVYRALIETPVQSVVAERVVPAPYAPRPFVTTDPLVTTGYGGVMVPPYGVTPVNALAVGARIPSWVQLYYMPAETIAAAPAIGAYRYAVIDNRIYLVDPRDGIVAGMLYQ